MFKIQLITAAVSFGLLIISTFKSTTVNVIKQLYKLQSSSELSLVKPGCLVSRLYLPLFHLR